MDEATRSEIIRKLHYDIHPVTGCWLWRHTPARGYAGIRVGGQHVRAHRAAYMAYRGDIEPGFILLHACDNKSCVNPWHLFAGSDADNMADFAAKRGPRRGEANNKSKLRAEDIPVIFARAAAGETHRAIAADYGVSRPAISQILRGGAWGHVSRELEAGLRPDQ